MPTPESKPTSPSQGPGAGQPAGAPVQGCAPCGPPESLPATCAAAPKEIQLPADVNKSMQTSYGNSFPGGKSQERGGTLVKDSSGKIKVVNEKSGTSGTMSPDRNVGAGETIIGTYHTHPYDASEGGHKGVSLSGADIAYANSHQEPIYVDAGNKQFMLMPSKNTKATSAQINNDWDAEFQRRLAAGESMQDASAGATNHVAKKYDMAYYEGKNGTLKKVSC